MLCPDSVQQRTVHHRSHGNDTVGHEHARVEPAKQSSTLASELRDTRAESLALHLVGHAKLVERGHGIWRQVESKAQFARGCGSFKHAYIPTGPL
jgi:hypothetical protein